MAKTKKKISHTEQLRRLRADRDRWRTCYYEESNRCNRLINELDLFDKIYPKKHYRLTFKAKAKNDHMLETKEIVKGHGIENCIHEFKKALIHPDTFELIDIELIE